MNWEHRKRSGLRPTHEFETYRQAGDFPCAVYVGRCKCGYRVVSGTPEGRAMIIAEHYFDPVETSAKARAAGSTTTS